MSRAIWGDFLSLFRAPAGSPFSQNGKTTGVSYAHPWESPPETGESKARILMEVRQFGYRPSDDQLQRWRRLGLLPEPLRRVAYGRGGGSDVYYPADTAKQLLDLLHFREKVHQLEQVGWLLWGRGHPVFRFVRNELAKYFPSVAEWSFKTLRALESRASEERVDLLPTIPLPSQFELRFEPGAGDSLLNFFRALSDIRVVSLLGHEVRIEDLVGSMRLVGLEDERTSEVGSPEEREALRLALTFLLAEFDGSHLVNRARDCPDARLLMIREEARQEWRWISDLVAPSEERPFPPMLFVFRFAVHEGEGRLTRELAEFMKAGLKAWQEQHRDEYRNLAAPLRGKEAAP